MAEYYTRARARFAKRATAATRFRRGSVCYPESWIKKIPLRMPHPRRVVTLLDASLVAAYCAGTPYSDT